MWVRAIVSFVAAATVSTAPVERFADDFEDGLRRWRLIGENGVRLVDSGDRAHGRVMELAPNGDVAAIVKGSEDWGAVRLEGEMSFRTAGDNYLGFLYHFNERRGRQDFGLIYLKGNENYLQVNPHRDFNVSRLIYPELRTALTGASAVGVAMWHRFAMEVSGRTAHVYVGDEPAPAMTFDGYELERGGVGLQPRSVGGPVWIDNVRLRSIDALTYSGSARPAIPYNPATMIKDWQVSGPLERTDDRIAQRPDTATWSNVSTDARGALVTGAVVDYHGPRTVAYFRTNIDSARHGESEVQFSTADDLAIWLNGEFQSFVARQDAAWFDFATNKLHPPRRVPVTLKVGRNVLVVRVRGGVYASGGFYARTLPAR